MAQEAMVRLFRAIKRVDDPHAWVYLVATNLVRDRWRRQFRYASALRMLGAATHRRELSALPHVGGVRDGVPDAAEVGDEDDRSVCPNPTALGRRGLGTSRRCR